MDLEVSAIYLVPVGGALTVLVDYGHGPGVLTDDGRIMWTGEAWLTERQKPQRMGRYRMAVNPWSPSISAGTEPP